MNAIQLANELEVVSWKDAQTEAADMLRRQHEAIVKLREACEWASVALDGVIDLLPKPESTECRNARKDILKALADTEEMK